MCFNIGKIKCVIYNVCQEYNFMKISFGQNINNHIHSLKEQNQTNCASEQSLGQNSNYCVMPNYKNYSHYLVNFDGITSISNAAPTPKERLLGCLVGGAIGDALGAKIEASKYEDIQARYGKSGLRYIPKTQGIYQVTDDTQMALFTIEGLLNNYLLSHDLDSEPNYNLIYKSYLDWYKSQTQDPDGSYFERGLLGDSTMYKKCAPGKTCMEALEAKTKGTMEEPVNNSFGNGGIMRSAPIGLLYSNPELAFKVACKSTALTHGHPDAYLSAGCFSAIISMLQNGYSIEESIEKAVEILKDYENSDYVLENIKKAIELAQTDLEPVEAIEKHIGKGVNGAQALGVALYCVLKTPSDYKKTVINAVNHSGDSDTTGAIAGNISGVLNGSKNIPVAWQTNIEHLDWINKFATTIDTISKSGNQKSLYAQSNILARWSDDSLN